MTTSVQKASDRFRKDHLAFMVDALEADTLVDNKMYRALWKKYAKIELPCSSTVVRDYLSRSQEIEKVNHRELVAAKEYNAVFSLMWDGWSSKIRQNIYAFLLSHLNWDFEVKVTLVALQALDDSTAPTLVKMANQCLDSVGIPLNKVITGHSDTENTCQAAVNEMGQGLDPPVEVSWIGCLPHILNRAQAGVLFLHTARDETAFEGRAQEFRAIAKRLQRVAKKVRNQKALRDEFAARTQRRLVQLDLTYRMGCFGRLATIMDIY
jgi:hypothetical protein